MNPIEMFESLLYWAVTHPVEYLVIMVIINAAFYFVDAMIDMMHRRYTHRYIGQLIRSNEPLPFHYPQV